MDRGPGVTRSRTLLKRPSVPAEKLEGLRRQLQGLSGPATEVRLCRGHSLLSGIQGNLSFLLCCLSLLRVHAESLSHV